MCCSRDSCSYAARREAGPFGGHRAGADSGGGGAGSRQAPIGAQGPAGLSAHRLARAGAGAGPDQPGQAGLCTPAGRGPPGARRGGPCRRARGGDPGREADGGQERGADGAEPDPGRRRGGGQGQAAVGADPKRGRRSPPDDGGDDGHAHGSRAAAARSQHGSSRGSPAPHGSRGREGRARGRQTGRAAPGIPRGQGAAGEAA